MTADGDSILCYGRQDLLTAEVTGAIASQKTELLRLLRNRNGTDLEPVAGGDLSYSQERLWLADRLETDRAQFLITEGLRLNGEINRKALLDSLSEIVRRHEVLRTNFPVKDGKPTRVVAPEGAQILTEIDLCETFESGGDDAVKEYIHTLKHTGLDILEGPVFRTWLIKLEQNHHVILFLWHHIVFDGYSRNVFVNEFGKLYKAFDQDEESPLPELGAQFETVARRQRKILDQGAGKKQLAFWRKQLDGVSTFELPRDTDYRAQRTSRGKSHSIQLGPTLAEALVDFSKSERATLFMTLLAGFKLLLFRHTNREDVVIGSPVAGRADEDSIALIGCFLNSLVLRSDLSGNPTFRELLDRVKETTLNGFDAQDVPFEAVLNDLQPERVAGRTPLFQIFFNMQYVAETKFALPSLQIEPFRVKHDHAKFDLTFYVSASSKGIKVTAAYNAGLYSSERISELLGQYEFLLGQIVENPGLEIASYQLCTSESTKILPDPALPLDASWPGPVHEIFSRNAGIHPQKTAIVDRSAKTSYEVLDRITNRLANSLIDQNLKKGDVVAILAHRSSALIWAMLSVMKTGASFLMIDLAYPAERIIAYLETASTRAVLSFAASPPLDDGVSEWINSSPLAARIELPEVSEAESFLDNLGARRDPPNLEIKATDQAYIAFTSGSTGKPKGIKGGHGSLTHFEGWMQERFGLSHDDRVSMLSGLSHDPLQREVFSGLYRGATIVIPDPEQITGYRLAEWARENALNVLNLTPAMARILTSVPDGFVVDSVRQIFLVGEALTTDTVSGLHQVCPQATVVNTYGATETQRAVGFFEVARPGAAHDSPQESPQGAPLKSAQGAPQESPQDLLTKKSRIPVGRGMKDVQLLVLNRADGLCGMYEIGEICLRSPHLAIGYLEDEESTALRFITNPFIKNPFTENPFMLESDSHSLDRIYRTGDFGYYDSNGDVIYEGRKDGQVSIRGFRIERAEIESAVRGYPGVSDTAVGFRTNDVGAQSIVAYVVPALNDQFEIPSLMLFLKGRLPTFMVPSSVVMLDKLPMSPNGKIMYDKLPEPSKDRDMVGSHFVAPRTSVESSLASIWSEILEIETVGVEDDFFDLGGHSMLALRLSDKIARAFGVVISLIDLFNATTITRQAGLLAERSGQTTSPENTSVLHQESITAGPDIFLIPGMGGYGVVFTDLVAHLSKDLKVHALSAPGLDGHSEALDSISELARYYINEIKNIQPEGPYNLTGFSFGGQIAYEIVQLLQGAGHTISYLAAIDAMPPISLNHLQPGRKFVRVARFHILNVVAPVLRWIRSRSRLIDRNSKQSVEDYMETGLDEVLVEDSMSSRLAKTISAHRNAVRSYSPAPYSGRMTLIRSSIQTKRLLKARWYSLYHWSDFVSDFHVIEHEGTHIDIVKDPKAASLASVIVAGVLVD